MADQPLPTQTATLLAADPVVVRAPVEATPPATFAVVVAHGMGQQVKFETLDLLASGLARAAETPPPTQARLVTIAGERLHRIELQLPTCTGPREVHLYETYWAPLTEGQVTLRDVTRFLLLAGWRGIRNGTATFYRWLFGAHREFTPPVRTIVYLLVGLAVVLSLVVINSAIAVVMAARLTLPDRGWPGPGLIGDLSTLFNVLLAAAGLVGAALWLARGARARPRRPNRSALPVLLGLASLVLFIGLISVTVAIGVAVPAVFFLHLRSGPAAPAALSVVLRPAVVDAFNGAVEMAVGVAVAGAVVAVGVTIARGLLRARRRLPEAREAAPYAFLSPLVVGMFGLLGLGITLEILGFVVTGWRLLPAPEPSPPGLRTLAWLAVVALSVVARRVLIEYVGDVAVYVQPHILDRFSATREAIKERVRRQVTAVYSARRPDGRFTYTKVALVGHSLGSVVLYDTLNRLINDDALARSVPADNGGGPSTIEVVSRTALLLTLGSPLDKTAFVFGSERAGRPVRAALEATVQPLITDAAHRQFDWINVYSPWDIISGRLDYYDPPDDGASAGAAGGGFKRVDNMVDPDATTLLLAHLEYWENSRMYDMLLARIP